MQFVMLSIICCVMRIDSLVNSASPPVGSAPWRTWYFSLPPHMID
jgi:hypothetical protein